MTKPEKEIVVESVEEIEAAAAEVEAAAAAAEEAAEAVEAEVIDELEDQDGTGSEPDGSAAAPEGDSEEAERCEEAECSEGAQTESAESADAQIAQAKAQAADWQGKYLRLHAEWDTYRRRKTEEAAAEKARATEKLVNELIPVIDDFERTIDYANKNGEEGLLGGVEAVLKKFLDVLQRSGVEIIDPEGEAYNALEAQAVATVPDESVPDETVAQVYQKGYKMGAKVLRSAMVTVTTGGPAREKPAEGEEKDE